MASSENILKLLASPDDIKIRNLKKCNMTPKDLSDSVDIILEWFIQQPHLPDVDLVRRRVENVVISCKGSIARSKSVLDTYYTLRTACDIFMDRDPLNPKIMECLGGWSFVFTPNLTPEGNRIACINMSDKDNFDLKSYIKFSFMIFDLRMQHDNGCDIITISDLSGIKLSHITQVTPFLIKIYMKACQEAYVARIKAMHVVNVPAIADTLITLFKSLISEKLRSRLFLHRTCEDLHKVIDKKLLPKDFGGELRSIEEIQGDWNKELVANRDWFLEEDQHRTNENRRLGKPVINDMLGTHGSFRKLDVD